MHVISYRMLNNALPKNEMQQQRITDLHKRLTSNNSSQPAREARPSLSQPEEGGLSMGVWLSQHREELEKECAGMFRGEEKLIAVARRLEDLQREFLPVVVAMTKIRQASDAGVDEVSVTTETLPVLPGMSQSTLLSWLSSGISTVDVVSKDAAPVPRVVWPELDLVARTSDLEEAGFGLFTTRA